ncbi:cell wall-binding repeat-containing protein [Nostocoides vanveenii]|uniref:NodB homology domain-containing protein n=1 Tax=Nostocoides vanveenii TaxID=330835 RepID=A0ABN2KBZ8_9MICO
MDFRIERLSGIDRYAAAAAISRRFHPAGSGVVAVASGEAYADGIAAGTFAADGGMPVLFVKRDHIPSVTAAELDRLQPSMIFVFGGPSTISEEIVRELGSNWTDEGAVERIGGADRFEVAAAASARAFTGPLRTVYVASGRVWPDGLTGGAAAAVDGSPMLLTDTAQLPATTEAELRRLSPGRILLLGGPASVSSTVADALGQIAPIERVWGADRYSTALAIAKRVFGSDRPGLMVATGANYPDALAGSAAAVVTRGPILLSRDHGLPPGTDAELTRLGPDTAYLLGGTASVPIEIPRLVQKELGVCWAGFAPPDGRTEVISAVAGVSGQKIANTFDMGGRMTGAADIVRYLIDHQVCTTFFPTSIMADTPEGHDVMALIAAHPELFEIGNHTVHHCDLVRGGGGSPTAAPCQVPMTDSFVRAELSDAETVLRGLSGMTVRPYWRPPFGSSDARVQSLATSVGYPKTMMWSRDTADWDPGTSTADILDAVLNPTPPAGTIVLNHLGGYNTGAALPTIISTLRARGVTVTTVSDLMDG